MDVSKLYVPATQLYHNMSSGLDWSSSPPGHGLPNSNWTCFSSLTTFLQYFVPDAQLPLYAHECRSVKPDSLYFKY